MGEPAGIIWMLKVQVEAHQEEDAWVATCPALDVASQGDSQDHALEMLKEAVELFVEDCAEHDTLWEILAERNLAPTPTSVRTALDEPANAGATWLDIPIWFLPYATPAQAAVG